MVRDLRLTNREKWKNQWFRTLTPELKLFWIYIKDACDRAGVWEVDIELASFQIGIDFVFEEVNKILSDQIMELTSGKEWWIKDYCVIQQKEPYIPGEGNPAQKSAAKLLVNHGVYDEYVERYKIAYPGYSDGLDKAYDSLKDKNKEKEENKNKDSDKEKYKDNYQNKDEGKEMPF